MRALLFLNGNYDYKANLIKKLIRDTDLIIAVDGGASFLKKNNVVPDVLIGDFDSLSKDDLEYFRDKSIIFEYPTKKEKIDFELALDYVQSREIKEVIVLGGSGDRLDMVFTNIFLIASNKFNDINTRFINPSENVYLINNEFDQIIEGKKGDLVSLLPISKEVKGITIKGFEYPLENESLILGTSRGISNVFVISKPSIFVKDGILLAIHTQI